METNKNELKKLIKNPAVLQISNELRSLGKSSQDVLIEARFSAINERFYEITGHLDTLRIGSVLDAVVRCMKLIEGDHENL